MVRQVVVFDAADLDAESAFWAGIFGGRASSRMTVGTALLMPMASGGSAYSSHRTTSLRTGLTAARNRSTSISTLMIPESRDDEVMALGARLLQSATDLNANEGHQTYVGSGWTSVLHRMGSSVSKCDQGIRRRARLTVGFTSCRIPVRQDCALETVLKARRLARAKASR